MKQLNILIGCDDLIIGAIQRFSFTEELYEDFFPIIAGGRARFDREKLKESQAFSRDMVIPAAQCKPLKIIMRTTDKDDPDFEEEIIYPNVLLIKNDYSYTAKDYIILDDFHFAIAGSE